MDVLQMQLVQRYRNLVTGAETLESALREDFAEYLNAEIVLRTIVDVVSAVAWLRSTYLYIRVQLPVSCAFLHLFCMHPQVLEYTSLLLSLLL